MVLEILIKKVTTFVVSALNMFVHLLLVVPEVIITIL